MSAAVRGVGRYAGAVALIPFPPAADQAPAVHAALGAPPAARWINPDHLTSLIPATLQGDHTVELVVDYKLQGLPEGRWHLGHYKDLEHAHEAWAEFIGYLTRHTFDPARLTPLN
jgi:hypothetical protein